MSWKDKLQTASFREVPFFVRDHTVSVGRRNVSHDFPYGEKPFTEDLGKKSREFNLSGFIVGDDYFESRDKIIAAAETRGSGILVHPYLGRMHVNCKSLTISEDTENGRTAKISFDFIESGDVLSSKETGDKVAAVTQSTADLKEKTLSNFEKIYAIADTAKSGIQKAKDAVNQVVDGVKKSQKMCADIAQVGNDLSQLIREVSAGIDTIITFPDKVAALFETSYGALSSSIDGFLSKNDPKRLAMAAGMISDVSGTLASPNQSVASTTYTEKQTISSDAKRIEAWKNLSQTNVVQVQILDTTATEANTEEKNRAVIETTARLIGFAYLADCVSSALFSSARNIEIIRLEVMQMADNLMENPLISDDIFRALQNTQISVTDALESTQNELPIIRVYEVRKNTNSLCFLYDHFSRITGEEDLIKRNTIKDPAHVGEGIFLEVAV